MKPLLQSWPPENVTRVRGREADGASIPLRQEKNNREMSKERTDITTATRQNNNPLADDAGESTTSYGVRLRSSQKATYTILAQRARGDPIPRKKVENCGCPSPTLNMATS